DETPAVVTRLKKHPAMLAVIARVVEEQAAFIQQRLEAALAADVEASAEFSRLWAGNKQRPLRHRLHAVSRFLEGRKKSLSPGLAHAAEREVERALARNDDLTHLWADLLSDAARLRSVFAEHPAAPSDRELERALEWCHRRCSLVLGHQEHAEE